MLTWRSLVLLVALALVAPRSAAADAPQTATAAWLAWTATGLLAAPPEAETLPASDVSQTQATLHGRVRPRGQVTQYSFEWGTSVAYGNVTATHSTPNSGRPVDVSEALSGLTPATTYHYRIVASSESGPAAGQDVQFTTAPEPPPPPAPTATPAPAGGEAGAPAPQAPAPQLGVAVVLRPLSGAVYVRPPRGRRFALGDDARPVPVGSVIDTRKGAVRLVAALARGGTHSGVFSRGRFRVRQPRRARGRTDLLARGGSFRRCPQRRRARTASASRRAYDRPRRVVRRLWGRTRRGRFRTHGRDSVATVRGTRWGTIDRCDGTLTRVLVGKVRVRDRRKRRTVLVRAGRSYLARRGG